MNLETINATLPDLFRLIDLTGVLLNGLLGGRLARQKRFDVVGFIVLAIISALGGGIIRDTLLQAGPPVALTDPYYLATALLGATIAMLWRLDSKWSNRGMVLADGAALGTWAAVGSAKTLGLGFGIMPAILLGMITAVGGGMVRDVCAGNVPRVFGGNNLYATPAAVSAIIMTTFYHFHLEMTGMLLATVVGTAFVVVSHWRRWRLPQHDDWTITMTGLQLRALLRKQGATVTEFSRAKKPDQAATDKLNKPDEQGTDPVENS